MATITRNGQDIDHAGIRTRFIGVYAGPASYAAGGDSFTAAEVKLGVIQHLTFSGVASNATATRLLYWNRSTNKIMWFVPETGAEVADAQNMSGYTVSFEAVGR